jgi:hypothetical protein
MYNARCLTEGVDIGTQKDRPVDAVAFTSPRRSVVDIVQAAGRAMRKGSKKKVGYVLIPIIVPDDMDLDKFAETTPFKEMARIIKALAIADPRIVDELRAFYYGKVSSGKIIKIEGEPIGLRMPFDEFASALLTRVWDVVARGNWRSFEDARAFARSLKLKSASEWWEYCQSRKKPNDIPSNPNIVYDDWAGYGDWLGTRARRGNRRRFSKARAFARSLNLKSTAEWFAYAKTLEKPDDIPANPKGIYEGDGWAGMGDWLGTGRIASHLKEYLSFRKARAFVRSLNLKSETEWRAYTKSSKMPDDIPAGPSRTYAKDGWAGMGDWLGTGRIAPSDHQYPPFKQARAFARSLNLKSGAEWRTYTQSGKKSANVPTNPNRTYAKDGWAGMGDWLGTGTIACQLREYPSFKKARAFARSLNLKSETEWREYCKSGERPLYIPSNPDKMYANDGWAGMSDWLGYGRSRRLAQRGPKKGLARHLRVPRPDTRSSSMRRRRVL